MAPTEQIPLFVVEDSEDDLFLFRRILGKAGITNPVEVASNGQAAIEQLATRAKNEALPLPRLLFLDLKLPLRSGFDVLQWVRSQPAFAATVTLILSSSAEARDVKRAYELGANGYLVKYPAPAVLREVVDAVAALKPGAVPDNLVLPGVPKPV